MTVDAPDWFEPWFNARFPPGELITRLSALARALGVDRSLVAGAVGEGALRAVRLSLGTTIVPRPAVREWLLDCLEGEGENALFRIGSRRCVTPTGGDSCIQPAAAHQV